MASQAVNINSFVNYIVSLCTYRDGTVLSDANKSQLKAYLLEKFTAANPQQVISVGTAYNLLQDLHYTLTGSYNLLTNTEGFGNVLSVNTTRDLVNAVIKDVLNHFVTPAMLFTSTECNADNCRTWELFLPAAASFTVPSLIGTLWGAGGGGSGAISGDGDKNGSFTLTSGRGGIGNNSTIAVNGTVEVTAYGGARGTSVSQQCAGDANFNLEGKPGGNGKSTSVSLSIPARSTITIVAGQGGAGGSGCTAIAGGTTGTVTFTGNDGQGYNEHGTKGYCLGGVGVAGANEWTGEDACFAGGGGNGGTSVSRYSQEVADSAYLGVTTVSGTSIVRHSGSLSVNGVGGRGGYTNLLETVKNGTTLGLGGAGGTFSYANNTYSYANGGSGGNAGGFVINTSCSAANTLFIYKS